MATQHNIGIRVEPPDSLCRFKSLVLIGCEQGGNPNDQRLPFPDHGSQMLMAVSKVPELMKQRKKG